MGVRWGSRPKPSPGSRFSQGSCTAPPRSAHPAFRSRRHSRGSACPAGSGGASPRRGLGAARRGWRCASGRDCRAPNSARLPPASPFVFVDQSGDRRGVPGRKQQLEIEGQMDTRPIFSVVGDQPFEWQIDLTDQNPIRILRRPRAASRRRPGDLGLVCRVELQEAIDVGLARRDRRD